MTLGSALAAAAGDRDAAGFEVFADATPDLLEQRLLQQRVDRKFAMSRSLVPAFVGALTDSHRLLRAAGQPAATYDTCYFDTDDCRLFHEHRRGRVPRFKVRIRHQVERQLSFLEIKHKRHDGVTTKYRSPRAFRDTRLDEEAAEFIGRYAPVPALLLHPALWLTFRRATLLGVRSEERLTVDWDFQFRRSDRLIEWPRLAIVEIKLPRSHHQSPAVRSLRRLGVRETRVSKYCLGMATLTSARTSAFKPVIRALERLSA
jgi:hypothetical protein